MWCSTSESHKLAAGCVRETSVCRHFASQICSGCSRSYYLSTLGYCSKSQTCECPTVISAKQCSRTCLSPSLSGCLPAVLHVLSLEIHLSYFIICAISSRENQKFVKELLSTWHNISAAKGVFTKVKRYFEQLPQSKPHSHDLQAYRLRHQLQSTDQDSRRLLEAGA